MKLADLKPGMVVSLRGSKFKHLVTSDEDGELYLTGKVSWCNLRSHSEDMECELNEDITIDAVWYPVTRTIDYLCRENSVYGLKLLWERNIIDWSMVEVDTKLIVSLSPFTVNNKGIRRRFAKFEDGEIYVWDRGRDSFTTKGQEHYMQKWKYAKLFTDDEGI